MIMGAFFFFMLLGFIGVIVFVFLKTFIHLEIGIEPLELVKEYSHNHESKIRDTRELSDKVQQCLHSRFGFD